MIRTFWMICETLCIVFINIISFMDRELQNTLPGNHPVDNRQILFK
jgi:hypothetical protein